MSPRETWREQASTKRLRASFEDFLKNLGESSWLEIQVGIGSPPAEREPRASKREALASELESFVVKTRGVVLGFPGRRWFTSFSPAERELSSSDSSGEWSTP